MSGTSGAAHHTSPSLSEAPVQAYNIKQDAHAYASLTTSEMLKWLALLPTPTPVSLGFDC